MDRQKIASTGQLALRTGSGVSGKVVILLSETMLFHHVFHVWVRPGEDSAGSVGHPHDCKPCAWCPARNKETAPCLEEPCT